MAKKKLLFFSIFIIIILVFVLTIYNIIYKNNNIYLNNKDEAPNFISIMLEETAGSGEYKVSKSNKWPSKGYVFNKEMSYCNNGSTLTWNKNDNSVSVNINKTDKCYVYFDIYVPTIAEYCTSGTDLATCVKNFGDQGSSVSNIYIHNSSLANGAGDNSYRYAGTSDSVNNFVCFGSTTSPCPEDNLYRIIGVIDGKVKLIKSAVADNSLLGSDGTYAYDKTYYKWSNLSSCPNETAHVKNSNLLMLANKNVIAAPSGGATGCNNWKYSDLNTTNLNTNYLNNIGPTWSNMIEDTTWKVSGCSSFKGTAKNIFTEEITNATKTYGPSDGTSKIGLMYVSDYGFAASPEAWTLTMNAYDNTIAIYNNWMYSKKDELTLLSYSNNSIHIYYLSSNGGIYYMDDFSSAQDVHNVRPVFYLKFSVKYIGGKGLQSDPIQISD